MRVKLSTPAPSWPWARQSPGGDGRWGDCEFQIGTGAGECDAWVVYDDLVSDESAQCPSGATILITGEPPAIKQYPAAYLAQFALVQSSHPDHPHPRVLLGHPAGPWHVGRRVRGVADLGFHLDYDELKRVPLPVKTRCCSVVCSNKFHTPGHKQRLEFVRRLSRHFGPRLDVFGRGWRDIEDKWDAIAPYRYHLALENSSLDHYWTEKLADAYLGGAYPLYHGCPNLADYFPAASFTAINIARPVEAIGQIEAVLETDVAARAQAALRAARELVLDRYNLYPVMAELVRRVASPAGARQTVTLRPAAAFAPAPARGPWRRLRQLLRPG